MENTSYMISNWSGYHETIRTDSKKNFKSNQRKNAMKVGEKPMNFTNTYLATANKD